MNQNRITRRQALAVSIGALVAGTVVGAPVPKDNPNSSWVGKTVLPKKYAMTVAHRPWNLQPNPDGTPVEFSALLHGASHDVKGEKGTRIEVFDSNFACWIEKEQLVLLADAVEVFTKALKANEKDTFALTSRGWAHYLLGKPDKAIADFDSFLKLSPAGRATPPGIPQRWEGLVNRGLVLAEQG